MVKEHKIIRLYISKEDYEKGIEMLGRAAQIAWSHGLWDEGEARRIFTDRGWLPSWEELEDDVE